MGAWLMAEPRTSRIPAQMAPRNFFRRGPPEGLQLAPRRRASINSSRATEAKRVAVSETA